MLPADGAGRAVHLHPVAQTADLAHPARVVLDQEKAPGDAQRVNLPHPEIYAALVPETRLLLDDGKMVLRVTDEGDLANRALGLIAAIRALRLPSLRERGLTISVGGVFCSDPGGWSSWYSQADRALFDAKNRGGDNWRLAP